MATSKNSVLRHDLVLIRKSTDSQANQEQEANVELLLKKRDVVVPKKHWQYLTIGRRKVLKSADFDPILEQVRKGQIRNIYVESQDRFGGKNNKELFSVLHVLQENNTRLWDLTENRDLTSNNFSDEIQALIDGNKSQKELSDTSRRSIRSRCNNFKTTSSWPGGSPPFGYGKACYNPDGKLRWQWHPTHSKAIGDLYNSDGVLSESSIKMPRKDRADGIFLVPNVNKNFVKTVKTIFDLFANHGLSRREIAIRLNKEGMTFYGNVITHSNVSEMVRNRAYIGDTVFGKTQSAELNSFNEEGEIFKIEEASEKKVKLKHGKITKTKTHKALLKSKTWSRSQERLQREDEQKNANGISYSARSPKYYLKNILVCGHCGKTMIGRTDGGIAKYQCVTNSTGRSRGQESKCGFYTITHDLAEELIFNELKQRDCKIEEFTGKEEKRKIERRYKQLDIESEIASEKFETEIHDGTKALLKYIEENYELPKREISKLSLPLKELLRYGKIIRPRDKSKLPLDYSEIKDAFKTMEKAAIQKSKGAIELLEERHTKLTMLWTEATDKQKAKLKTETDRLEAEIELWESRTVPISKRLRAYWIDSDERNDERKSLIAEWSGMDGRIKGENLKRIIDRVELFWKADWHEAEANPSRKRKTKRAGRKSFHLLRDEINFVFKGLDSLGSW